MPDGGSAGSHFTNRAAASFVIPTSFSPPALRRGGARLTAASVDIIGGNSGSPVFDRDLRIVGLVFDGNLPSLGGDYGFDAAVNRAVSVHSSAILEALSRIYGADRLVAELAPDRIGAPARHSTPR